MTSAPRADWPTEPLDRMLVPAAAPAATQPATKVTQRARASHGWQALHRPIRPGDIRTARVRPPCWRRSGLLLVIIVILRWEPCTGSSARRTPAGVAGRTMGW